MNWREDKVQTLLFLWVAWDRREVSLRLVHLPHTTSNCGDFRSEICYTILLATRFFSHPMWASAEGQDVVSSWVTTIPSSGSQNHSYTAQLVTAKDARYPHCPHGDDTVELRKSQEPHSSSPFTLLPLRKHNHKLLAPRLNFAQQNTNSQFQTRHFPLLSFSLVARGKESNWPSHFGK